MLGHLATEQRGAGLSTAVGDTSHDRGGDVGIQMTHREVVEEEERVATLRRDVVGSPNEIDANGVVPTGLPREYRLRAHAVGGRDKDRIAVVQRCEVEESAESAESAEDSGTVRRTRVTLDQLDGAFAGGDVDTRSRVREWFARHEFVVVRSTIRSSSTRLASATCRSTDTG